MKLIEEDGHHYFVVGDRRWCATNVFREDHELERAPHLTADGWMRSRGCRVRFETGWEVSIIWGNLTYSSNRGHPWMFHNESLPKWTEEPATVEVMVMNHKGKAADQVSIVLGWVDHREMTALFDLLAKLPTNATFRYSMIREDDT
jgi:hypothetical protein